MPKPLKNRGEAAPGCETWSSVASFTLVWACLSDFRVSEAIVGCPFVFSLLLLGGPLAGLQGQNLQSRIAWFKIWEQKPKYVILNIQKISAYPAHQHRALMQRIPSPVLHPLVNFPRFLVYMSSSTSRSGAAEQSSFQRKQRPFISGFHFLFLLFGKLYNI